ncbi:MAG: TRAP transporter TatT component family protein, partial [Syntrophales bacterium]|nr:TRAP transporter TatT component family protein [Syntrophales bacterium]
MKKHGRRFAAGCEIVFGSVGCMRFILQERIGLWLLTILLLTGCGDLVHRQATPLIGGLTSAIGKQNDPQLVCEGAPAYLLLADGFLEMSPDDHEMLMHAAQLYAAYTSAFLMGREEDRARRLSIRARDYAFRAAAIRIPAFGTLYQKPFAEFEPVTVLFQKGDEALLLLIIKTWAAVIQTSKDDWDLLADIAKIEALTKRLLALDEGYEYGAA